MHTTNNVNNKKRKQQQQHFLSNSSSDNSHGNKSTDGDSQQLQFPPLDHDEIVPDDKFENNQDIENKVQTIQDTFRKVTTVEIDEKLIFIIASLPDKKREQIMDVLTDYLTKYDVDNIDGLVATAIRDNWRPGKQSRKKLKKAANNGKFKLLYLT